MVMFQILLDGAEAMMMMMRGRPSCLLQSARGEANRILLASALLSMHIICPNKVSRREPRGVGCEEGVSASPQGEGFGEGAVPPSQKKFYF